MVYSCLGLPSGQLHTFPHRNLQHPDISCKQQRLAKIHLKAAETTEKLPPGLSPRVGWNTTRQVHKTGQAFVLVFGTKTGTPGNFSNQTPETREREKPMHPRISNSPGARALILDEGSSALLDSMQRLETSTVPTRLLAILGWHHLSLSLSHQKSHPRSEKHS